MHWLKPGVCIAIVVQHCPPILLKQLVNQKVIYRLKLLKVSKKGGWMVLRVEWSSLHVDPIGNSRARSVYVAKRQMLHTKLSAFYSSDFPSSDTRLFVVCYLPLIHKYMTTYDHNCQMFGWLFILQGLHRKLLTRSENYHHNSLYTINRG